MMLRSRSSLAEWTQRVDARTPLLVRLRFHVFGPATLLCAAAIVAAAFVPMSLAKVPNLELRFGILCGANAVLLLIWGRSAVRDAPRTWTRRRTGALTARYLELAWIAALFIVAFAHCALVAKEITRRWERLARDAQLHELLPLPYADDPSEARRRQVIETWRAPTLALTGHGGYLRTRLLELRGRRCWPAGTPPLEDSASEARCDRAFFGSLPATPDERAFVASLRAYENAIHELGGPAVSSEDVVRRFAQPTDFPGVMLRVSRIGFAFDFHRYAARYLGPLLLSAAAAFCLLFIVREAGLLLALLHVTNRDKIPLASMSEDRWRQVLSGIAKDIRALAGAQER